MLALVFEAVAVGVKVGAVLFGFAQVERAGAAGVDFGAGEVEGLRGVFAVGSIQRQLVVEAGDLQVLVDDVADEA